MSDPKRLVDELRGGDLKDLLDAGKSELPDDRQMAMLAAKMGVVGGLGGAGGAGGAGAGGAKVAVAATSAKVGFALKVAGAVAVASAVGTGAVVVSKQVEPPQTPVGIVATVSPSAMTQATNTARVSAPSASASEPAPSEPAPSANVRRVAPSASAAGGFEAEVSLLTRAQNAVRANPSEALALCSDHARDFPNGALIQEREVIAIEALVKTSRVADAKARAARFKARFPGSSHARRIDALIGE